MIKCNGREAISILAEVEANKRELTEDEEKYVRARANSFVGWLQETSGKTFEECKQIAIGIFDSEVRLLLLDDPYADFTWSRGNEVGDTEISGFSDGMPFELASNLECDDHSRYWEGNHLERHEGKYSDEQWKFSQDKLDTILDVLKGFEGLTVDGTVKKRLTKINARVNELRFGKQPVLMNRHWKIAKNKLFEIMGHSKKYEVREISDIPRGEDAMEYAEYGTVERRLEGASAEYSD